MSVVGGTAVVVTVAVSVASPVAVAVAVVVSAVVVVVAMAVVVRDLDINGGQRRGRWADDVSRMQVARRLSTYGD